MVVTSPYTGTYQPTNAYLDAPSRLAAQYQQQPMQQAQQMQQQFQNPVQQVFSPNQIIQQQVNNMLKGRAVTGIEEARASGIDFDGSVHYFSDIPNGYIYTKQIGMNGLSDFNVYRLVPKEEFQAQQTQQVQVLPQNTEEITELRESVTSLSNQVRLLEQQLEAIKKYGKSNANDGNDIPEPKSKPASKPISSTKPTVTTSNENGSTT